MKEAELISIIVPCYNIENLVASTVKTICNQTYRNLEIILVNDGSKDGTAKALDELAKSDNRIRVIHKKNGGVTRARLEGVRAAKGEWIGFVDGDDAIDADMYEHLLKNAQDAKANISHCGYQMVFPSRIDYYYNTGRLVKQDKISGLKDLLSGKFIEPGLCNKLFHKNLFHSLLHDDLMDASIKNFEDLLMNYYLFRESQFSVYEDFCPYHYMVRSGSAATSKMNEHKLGDALKVFRIIESIEGDHEILSVVLLDRITRLLIRNATMEFGSQSKLIRPYRNIAKKELRESLSRILRSNVKLKLKIQALWVAALPASYQFVHRLYATHSGLKQKYAVK